MSILRFIRNNYQLIGISSLICLDFLAGIIKLYAISVLWIYILHNIISYSILLLLIFGQIRKLDINNIDSFSIIMLLLNNSTNTYSNYPDNLKNFLTLVNIIISIILFIVFIKIKEKKVAKLSIKQLLLFLMGLIFGIGIALVKIRLSNSPLLELAYTYPILFVNSITIAVSTLIREEFLYRGLLWGFFREKKVNDYLIIVITSILWVLVHVNVYQNIPELINFFVLGIIFGFITKFTKSINASIGAHAGYSSFLIMQLIFFN